MARILVHADQISLVSNYSLADFRKVGKYSGEALTLKKGEELVFKACAGDRPSMSNYGVVFASETVNDAKACYTVPAPSTDKDDIKAYIEDTLGVIALNLGKVEQQMADALVSATNDAATIAGLIEGLEVATTVEGAAE